ncbi:MAG: response regulator [Spirochaetaceae bacterium]|nr:MAG: response regulator [Spirochaetaceae bacterium]
MRYLLAEDDFGSRRLLQVLLQKYGLCDVVMDGAEAVEAFRLAWEENNPYHAVFLDIMMPNLDGQQALRQIRAIETELGIDAHSEVKVVMTTALEDPKNVVEAYYQGGATSYLVKPIDRHVLHTEMERLGLIQAP